MHQQHIESWQHQHAFNVDKKTIEKRTLIVVIITFVMMIAEILVGWVSNSMSLLADGWHMGTHAFALGISLLAYILARKYSTDESFTFGTWKIEILGAYTSAIVLGMIGAILILSWAASLIRSTSHILLEREMDYPLVNAIKSQIESDNDTKISDLHVWKVAQNQFACIVSLVTGKQYTIEEYKKRLSMLPELVHVTVEKNLCR